MAVTPGISDILDNMNEIQDNFEQPSCALPDDPMVKYPDPGTGKVPVINFNIPQATAFNTYGKIAVPIAGPVINEVEYSLSECFKEFTSKIPANNYWNVVKGMSPDQVFQLMNPYTAAPAPVMAYMPVSLPGSGGIGYRVDTGLHLSAIDAMSRRDTVISGDSGLSTGSPVFMQPVSPKSDSPVASYASMGLRPVFITKLNGRVPATKYIAEPPKPNPRLFIVEEYTTAAFLGDYGAGRVVKTFSLLPGERTTITVRTYKDMESVRASSQNMLDSFSESSANELDKLIQHEDGNMESNSDTSSDSSSNFGTHTDASNSSSSWNLSANLSFAGFGASGGYGQSESDASSNANGWNGSNSHGHTGIRSSNVSNLNNALSKHVQQSNANRQININTSTQDTARSGEEDTTVRYLENYNKSRVLNFTFRQLLQEYITITSLTNLKFVYSNGYPESFTIVDMNNLDNMLKDLIIDGVPGSDNPKLDHPVEYFRDKFRCLLLHNYCSVRDYNEVMQPFIRRNKIVQTCPDSPTRFPDWNWYGTDVPLPPPGTFFKCGISAEPEYFWGLMADLHQIYDPTLPGHEGMNLKIPGVILSVKKQTLQTSSVIADALLGRGEALDCFNQKAQAAENMADFITNVAAMQRVDANLSATNDNTLMNAQLIDKMTKENDALQQRITILTDVGTGTGAPNAVEQVTGYKKVFGDCCPTPQYTGGCGCGNCKD